MRYFLKNTVYIQKKRKRCNIFPETAKIVRLRVTPFKKIRCNTLRGVTLRKEKEMDKYQDIQDMLGKLQRNESQMSPADLKRYEKPLQKLRAEIVKKSVEYIKGFTLMSVKIKEGEDEHIIKELVDNIQIVVDEVAAEGKWKGWEKLLFRSYDLDQLLQAAVFLKNRIDYEAYAPYWVSHCKKRKMQPNEDPFRKKTEEWEAYWNDIVCMWWDPDGKIWIQPDRICWACYFPPTLEENKEEYEKKKGEYDEWWVEQHITV